MNVRKTRVLYFVPCLRASTDGILYSQVLGQACALQNSGDFECMFVGSDTDAPSIQKAQQLPRFKELAAVRLYDAYPIPSTIFSMRRLTRQVASACENEVMKWRPDLIYLRSYVHLGVARRWARQLQARVIYDLRGLTSEEVRFRRTGPSWRQKLTANILSWPFRHWERSAIRNADIVMAVTEGIREWAAANAGRDDVTVVPCCVDTDMFQVDPQARQEIRAKLGWPQDAPVIVYSGSTAKWQRIEDVLAFTKAARAMVPELHLIVLTPNPDHARHLAAEAGLPSEATAIQSVPSCDVPRWLNAGDAGILLRANNLINNTAFPVKVGEYLACGLPIIISEGVGPAGLVAAHRAGLVLPDDSQSPSRIARFMMTMDRKAMQALARQAAIKSLTWQAYVPLYRKLWAPKRP